MGRKRRQFNRQFKFTVALEAVKGTKTVNQIAGEYNVHPNQVSAWKKQLLADGPAVFDNGSAHGEGEQAAREAELYEQIGRLKMELEWLKKKLPSSVEVKRTMIESDHPTLSIRRQCQLLDLNRATYYWRPASESAVNLALMRLIDREYTRAPFYGYRKMTARLREAHGYGVNRKWVD